MKELSIPSDLFYDTLQIPIDTDDDDDDDDENGNGMQDDADDENSSANGDSEVVNDANMADEEDEEEEEGILGRAMPVMLDCSDDSHDASALDFEDMGVVDSGEASYPTVDSDQLPQGQEENRNNRKRNSIDGCRDDDRDPDDGYPAVSNLTRKKTDS